jgi:hypothetical protein
VDATGLGEVLDDGAGEARGDLEVRRGVVAGAQLDGDEVARVLEDEAEDVRVVVGGVVEGGDGRGDAADLIEDGEAAELGDDDGAAEAVGVGLLVDAGRAFLTDARLVDGEAEDGFGLLKRDEAAGRQEVLGRGEDVRSEVEVKFAEVTGAVVATAGDEKKCKRRRYDGGDERGSRGSAQRR